MASKKTVNLDNLEALGAKRLAALLVELADGDATIARRLRLELAANETPESLTAEVRKRLAQIGRSSSFVDGRKIRDLATELEMQCRAIVEQVVKGDPAEALELLWQFMGVAESVQERCDDSNGLVGDVFRTACCDLGPIAKAAKADPIALADRSFAALNENGYGQYDDLIAALAPALGNAGLDHLKARFVKLSKTPLETPPQEKRKVIGWGSGGPTYEDELKAHSRASTVRHALQAIADAQGDVDAFIGLYDEKARRVPRIAARIARRLLAADRAEEALRTLDAVEHGRSERPDFEWEDVRIDALDALGRNGEAQGARWSCFERTLSADHLRAYLKRLPDFEDFEAEQKALDHAERYRTALAGLAFLISWPAVERAARLVVRRAGELDGNHYEILSPAADALAGKYPLAATLVLRSMIDFTLAKARSSRYRHAARHLRECASLATAISDFGAIETHDAYAARLRNEHGRKSGFWNLSS